MKILFLGDMHIGCRSDSILFAEHHIRFFEETLFPFIIENKINKIVQFGDVFDRRKFINFKILAEWKNRVFDWLEKHNVSVDVIAGNHDVYYRNTNEVNSPILLLREYSNINTFTAPAEVTLGETKVLYVPCINLTNEKEVMQAVNDTKATIAFGHFEFAGFQMDKGQINISGMSVEKFKKFEFIYSGHYHHRSNDGQIFYLGTPYQITWADYGSKKGFHVWDSNTLKIRFYQNPSEMFIKITYDDGNENHAIKDIEETIKNITARYVKVIVVSKKKIYEFDRLMEKLYAANPGDLKVVENMTDLDTKEEEEFNIEDTSSILSAYVDSFETSLDKNHLKHIIKTLYTEALHEGEV